MESTIDLKAYDVIIGYRADDSYFSFAESFVQNGLPLRSLNEALHLGRLGTQTVLISEKSFRNLTFDGADFADKTVYYPKFIARDSNARETYRKEIRNRHSYKNDIFVLDILREEMKDMMRSKIWLNVLIMRLAIVVLMQIYFQSCLSNLDMQTNLNVEIQRSFQEYLG